MRSGALRITIIYVVFALLWKALSDWILYPYQGDANLFLVLNGVRGIFFICITGFLLYKLILIDEKKLIETQGQYRRSGDEIKRLAGIITLVNNMIIITNKNNLIVWVNKAFEDTTGYQLDKIEGLTPSAFLHGPKTDKKVTTLIIQNKKSLKLFSTDIIWYTKNGDPFWVSGKFTPLFDDINDYNGYITVYNDITWRKQKEDEIIRQNDKLKEVAWLSSHEVRRPLANIMGLVKLIKSSSDIEEKMQIIEHVNQSAKELDEIVHLINSKILVEINI
jgi:PAS domain S-box-containing protein